MAKTTNLGLNILPAAEEATHKARDFMRELGGDDANSNMVIIDGAIGELQDHEKSRAVWSTEPPVGQVPGDIWYKPVTRAEGG